MAVFDPLVFDPLVFDAGEVPGAGPRAFRLFRNGVEEVFLFSPNHLSAMSFTLAAYDGEVGMGSMTIPGNPDWTIGDRISLMPLDIDEPFYTGYLTTKTLERNPESVTELQSTWQLMDLNRQGIGRMVVDQTFPFAFSLDDLVPAIKPLIEGDGSPEPTIDDTTWVDTDSSPIFPAKTYTGDGWMPWIADIIAYTGKTVYLTVSPTENEFYLNVHALTSGPTADIVISDLPSDLANVDTFAPQHPVKKLDGTDIKDDILGRNGVVEVPGETGHTHADGGLRFQAIIQTGDNEDSLILVVNTLLSTANVDKPTFTCTIGPLTSAQLLKLPAGSLVSVTSAVMDLIDTPKRASHITLSVTRDASGHLLPGLWDAALEMDYPLRGPTVLAGLGGQGTVLGAIRDYPTWTDTVVTEDDPAIPVGSFETATAQLVDDKGFALPIPDVNMTWGVYQADKTTVHPDYETYLDDETTTAVISQTDESGQAHIVVGRLADTIGATHTVQAAPV